MVPKKYRYLSWSWKILHTIPGGDETTKAGDDYTARIYVVFPGKYFWQTKTINYNWANYFNSGASIPNACTSSAVMVAVQSGPNNSGQWLVEKRDIFVDYKNMFGSDPGETSPIAIMTDTHDTGENAIETGINAFAYKPIVKADLAKKDQKELGENRAS